MQHSDFSFLFKQPQVHEFLADAVMRDSCQFRLSTKYRTYYRFFRPLMPIYVRQLLQRGRKVEVVDDWYKPVEFMRNLGELCESESLANSLDLWPDSAEFAFVLTHDVETAEGMRHIERIANVEESLGFRSSWNLVPNKYKIDMGLMRELQSRGFEIGIHGYNHDGRLFSSKHVFDRRAVQINEALKKYNATGFRAPMVHRNLEWLQALDVEYDSSCFDIDPFQAGPGGVGTIWPFVAGRLVELPYTLPQDHTLFVALSETDDRIWRDKLAFIRQHHGMGLMLTHPDYLTGETERNIYIRFLEHVKSEGNYWHALPQEVARWWRESEQQFEFDASEMNASTPSPGREFKPTAS